MFKILKGAHLSRSKKLVTPLLDDRIDGFVTNDLIGWFSLAKAVFEEEKLRLG